MNILTADMADRILQTGKDALTSNEISVLILLLKKQDSTGYCQGIYWRDIADYLGISKSGYYQVLKELTRKSFIERNKADRSDTDIFILDHDLTGLLQNLKERKNDKKYIKLNTSMFQDKDFYSLKANAKRMAIKLVKRYTKENAGKLFYNPMSEYKLFSKELQVEERSVREYFGSLKKWISVSNDRIVNHGVKHIVTILKRSIEQPKMALTSNGSIKETKKYAEYDAHEQIIRTYCRRNKITFDSQNLADTAALVNQYRKTVGDINKTFTYIKWAITNTMNEALELSSKVVNKVLGNIIRREEKKGLNRQETPQKEVQNNHPSAGQFNNLDQRDYDYAELEKILLMNK